MLDNGPLNQEAMARTAMSNAVLPVSRSIS
jgi:hypothetical protein